MIGAFALLLGPALGGEILARLLHLPLPGPVLGLGLLLLFLATVPGERPALTRVTGLLSANLSILFLPAAVGIMTQGPVLARDGVLILAVLAVSGVLTVGVTALVFCWAAGRRDR